MISPSFFSFFHMGDTKFTQIRNFLIELIVIIAGITLVNIVATVSRNFMLTFFSLLFAGTVSWIIDKSLQKYFTIMGDRVSVKLQVVLFIVLLLVFVFLLSTFFAE